MKNGYFKYICFSLNYEIIFYKMDSFIVVIEAPVGTYWKVSKQYNIAHLDETQRVIKITDPKEIKRLNKKRLLLGI